MRENSVERRLREEVEHLGGLCFKWVSPMNAGVPDRIVIMPDGRVRFVELKTIRGRLSKVQEYQMERLRKLGCSVHVLYGVDEVDGFVADVICGGPVRGEEDMQDEVRAARIPTEGD